MTPLWGLHWAILLAVCLPLRLDVGVAWIASNVSLPFIAPFITFAEIQIGARLLSGAWPHVTLEELRQTGVRDVGARLSELVVGTLVLAPVSAVVTGLLAALTTKALVKRTASS